ncbi:MAG: hypothetical protein JXO22_03515 [Phycisphaerae bacterium]|nr:hypothetical protein [Phycisphaerae bacterium]
MRNYRRLLFNVACIVSATLLAAAFVLLIAAVSPQTCCRRIQLGKGVYAGLLDRNGGCIWLSNQSEPYLGSIISLSPSTQPTTTGFGYVAGIYYRHHTWTWPQYDTWWTLCMSSWYPIIIFAVLPTIWLLRRWLARQRRLLYNACHNCGYNLTGNVTGRCPECGTDIHQPS